MEINDASRGEHLWHSMRGDLLRFAPELSTSNLLMCCACGRWLPFSEFNLEHIIPKQALKDDPAEVRKLLPVNVRSGTILLCKKPLKQNGKALHPQGCNSWKGRYYDRAIREIMNQRIRARPTQQHTIAALVVGYLAMIAEFGYQVALTPTGVLMRMQFFQPKTYVRDMPTMCQVVFMGEGPTYSQSPISSWERPFSFNVSDGMCMVGIRNFVAPVPLSRDPNVPIASRLRYAPSSFTLRPDFRTAFE